MQIRISGINYESIVDGKGIRIVIFTQGCLKNCPGCHNPETQTLDGGKIMDVENIFGIIKHFLSPLYRGVTFSGGEPFMWATELSCLAKRIKSLGSYDITTYTGFSMEQLPFVVNSDKLLLVTDYLITDPFILAQKDLSVPFRGSRNQRFWRKFKSGIFELVSDEDIINCKL